MVVDDCRELRVIQTLINDKHPVYAKWLLEHFCSEDYYESRGGNPADWPELDDYWVVIFNKFGWEKNEEFY